MGLFSGISYAMDKLLLKSKLKSIRLLGGWSRQELADILEITPQTINYLESEDLSKKISQMHSFALTHLFESNALSNNNNLPYKISIYYLLYVVDDLPYNEMVIIHKKIDSLSLLAEKINDTDTLNAQACLLFQDEIIKQGIRLVPGTVFNLLEYFHSIFEERTDVNNTPTYSISLSEIPTHNFKSEYMLVNILYQMMSFIIFETSEVYGKESQLENIKEIRESKYSNYFMLKEKIYYIKHILELEKDSPF